MDDFICPRHRRLLAADPERAFDCWENQTLAGNDANRNEDFFRAYRHYRASVSIAEMALERPWPCAQRPSPLEAHLIACHNLADLLAGNGFVRETDQYYERAHNALLVRGQSELVDPRERYEALSLVDKSLAEWVAFLERVGAGERVGPLLEQTRLSLSHPLAASMEAAAVLH